jgi:hypothetical protein
VPSTTIRKIDKAANGSVAFYFGKRGYHFNSIEEWQAALAERFSQEDLEWIAMAIARARQPQLNNIAVLEGRAVTITPGNNNWGTVS